MKWDLASHKKMKTGSKNDRNINAKENLVPEMIGENVFQVSPYRV